MVEIRVDVKFTQRQLGKWKDTEKRAEHVFDRMKVRGIGIEQIKESVRKGAKILEQDGRIISVFRWYKVIYREFRLKDTRKIYPITVFSKI